MPEDDGPGYSDLSAPKRQPRNGKSAHIVEGSPESGCNVRTQDPENFDEEVKSLVTAWRSRFDLFITARHSLSLFCWTIFLDSSFLHFGPTEEKKG